jgi:RND family efflux transporter MFP subunit
MRPPTIAVYDLPVTRTVTDYEEFPGETDSPYSVQVRARVSGYMTNVYFLDGTMVKKGDKLFQIDPEMYRADLQRAKGTVAQYEAHVKRLEKEYNRAKNLLARGNVSQEEYDRYEADLREAEANLEVARANRRLAELNFEWTEVTSPIDGLLSRRMVDPGNLIKADDTALTSVVSLDPLHVYFDVHEQAMLKLKRLMQQGKLKIQAQGLKAVPVQIGLSDEPDYPHRGLVDFTDNRVDLNTGTLRFRAKIENPADAYGNRFIVPGLFVRVRLPIGEPHPALMVREQALVNDQGRKTVWVIKEGKNKEGKTVQLATVVDVGEVGVLRDGYREVEKGIAPGDKVVVAGMQRLRPGLDVVPERYDEATRTGKASEKGESPRTPSGHESPAAKAVAEKDAGAARIEGGTLPGATAAPAPRGEAAPAATGTPAADDRWPQTPPARSGKAAGRSRPETRPGRAGR